METINIKIIHPTNNSDIDIGCPSNIILKDVFSQLIDANFLSSNQPYTGTLMPKGVRTESMLLDNDKTIGENGVESDDIVQTLIATQARGWVAEKLNRPIDANSDSSLGIKVLGISHIPEVSFEEMLKEKQSIIMALNSYQNLEEENRRTITDLRKMKQESNDRKSAVVVNTVAGIVISIGTAFLTEAVIPAVATISAGVLIIAVGLWLTFKKQK